MKKGEATRQAILDRATAIARTVGLEGLTIGRLAEELELSKSGLFAHFGSKEALGVAVIEHAREQFVGEVIAPALKARRGEPRLRAMIDRWLAWFDKEGGCLFVALAIELDDRPGPARDAIAASQRDWLETLATATSIAVSEKHLAAGTDPHQVAFELYGIMMSHHIASRLLDDPRADQRARTAIEALLERLR